MYELFEGCKMASEGGCGTKVKKHRGYREKDKKVRQAICINNNVRNRTAIGKTQISQEARRNKDAEFTSYLGEESNIY